MCRVSEFGEVRVESDSMICERMELIGKIVELSMNVFEFIEDLAMLFL